MVLRNRKQRAPRNLSRSRSRRAEKLECRTMLAGDIEFRSFDGAGNNENHDDWGSANTPLVRLTTVEYGAGPAPEVIRDVDGNIINVVFPAMAPRLDSAGNSINPRTVSNLLFDQDASLLNDRGLTSFVFQWGQFLDHDMDLTEAFGLPPGTLADEFIPFFANELDDELLDPPDLTEVMIPMFRSRFEVDDDGVAQQINQITSYIDASNVYGSSVEKAERLRAHFGGFLLTSDGATNLADGSGQFLPFNYLQDGEFVENAAPPTTGTGVPLAPDDLFVAGDVRSNEQPGLTSMHTLFVLEHNYQARRIADRLGLSAVELADPQVDEMVFQLARTIVSAEIQSITYNEFIPSLIGPDQLTSYEGYQEDVNAGIANIFSASLYRVGHTMLPNELLVLEEDGTAVPDDPDVLGAAVIGGQVALGDAFFNPLLITQFGIEPYLKGLADQQIQEIDHMIVDGVRNLLFDPPAAVDLGATNLQRGRDHGLADYNQTRADFGLDPAAGFSEISSDPAVVAALEAAYDAINDGVNGYDAINNIDVFAGAISEDHVPGGSLGPLLQAVLVDQFTRLRDGDRFYYENALPRHLLNEVQNTRLSDIIRRNTALSNVQDEAFRSADVFTYRAEAGEGAANVKLRVRDGELQVVTGFFNRVVASQDLADTSIVVIYGSNKGDTIQIDSSVAAHFTGSIELHGGGGHDSLIVEGTHDDDEVVVAPTAISVNDLSLFYGNFESVLVAVDGGNDIASVDGLLGVALTFAGGDGNDILVGGAGNEILIGGGGRDILVGGAGSDILLGSSGDDILIAGATAADLAAVQAVWTSAMSYTDRIDALRDEISSEDDGARDYLFGGFGQDWFLTNPLDLPLDRWFGEAVN